MRIQIINGPNINLLGKREPSIYGSVTFEDYLAGLRENYADVQIDYFQSNIEGELIDKIQQVGFDADGIILNAGPIPIRPLPCKMRSGRSLLR